MLFLIKLINIYYDFCYVLLVYVFIFNVMYVLVMFLYVIVIDSLLVIYMLNFEWL